MWTLALTTLSFPLHAHVYQACPDNVALCATATTLGILAIFALGHALLYKVFHNYDH